jgi:hypothetical protein
MFDHEGGKDSRVNKVFEERKHREESGVGRSEMTLRANPLKTDNKQ